MFTKTLAAAIAGLVAIAALGATTTTASAAYWGHADNGYDSYNAPYPGDRPYAGSGRDGRRNNWSFNRGGAEWYFNQRLRPYVRGAAGRPKAVQAGLQDRPDLEALLRLGLGDGLWRPAVLVPAGLSEPELRLRLVAESSPGCCSDVGRLILVGPWMIRGVYDDDRIRSGAFGDRRLEKGGPCCMRPFMSGARLAFGGSAAADRAKFSSRAFLRNEAVTTGAMVCEAVTRTAARGGGTRHRRHPGYD